MPSNERSDWYRGLVEALQKHGSKRAAARALGMAESTFRGQLAAALQELNLEDPAPASVPVSEDTRKFRAEWTEEDCIAELRRIVNLDLDRVVTRNYFRVNSSISEATWNRYFGTFDEFKRRAGIILTRQQHNLEKQIAKHASVDHYRALNAERASYEGKYLRPVGGRYKTALVMNDLHDIECDPFYLSVALDVAKRLRPTYVIFNGDIFDLPEFGKYGVDPRQWDVDGRIRFVHEKIFAPFRDAAPDSQFDLIEGNHEFRLMRHLADATPALMTVLSNLHGMNVAKLLGLDRFEVNYTAKADLAAYTATEVKNEVARNFKVYDDALLCHHFPEGRLMGVPGVNGHHHRFQVWPEYNNTYGAYSWIQAGCGHKRDASYCNGEKWSMGFTIAHIDTDKKQTNFEYVAITDFAVAGGKYYFRGEN